MVVRESNSYHLEVIELAAAEGVPIELDVYDGANPATFLAYLPHAKGVKFTRQLYGLGAGSFELNKHEPEVTATNIRQGNLVKVKVGGVYRFAFWLEEGELKPGAPGEQAAEDWKLGGPSERYYLSRAIMYPPGWPTPTGTELVYDATPRGAILDAQLQAAAARVPQPMPYLTWDFDATVDSQGAPWDDTNDLTFRAGTFLIDLADHLESLGLELDMTPSLKLRAFRERGVDRSASVVFRHGVNIRGGVTKRLQGSPAKSRILVEGSAGKFYEVTDPVLEAVPNIGRREGYLSYTNATTATQLQRGGEAMLDALLKDTDAISIGVEHGLGPGELEPWVDYAEGDWVTLHVPGEFDMAAYRIVAITVEQVEDDYEVTLDLNSVAYEALIRIKRQLDALQGGSGAGTATGGSGSTLGGGGGNPHAVSDGRVAAIVADTMGYLFDKLEAGDNIALSLAGAPGNAKVRIDNVPPPVSLALDDLTDVATAGAGAGMALGYVGGVWVPITVSTTVAYPLDVRTLHPTYGEHYLGPTLDTAKWTRRGRADRSEVFEVTSWMRALQYGGAMYGDTQAFTDAHEFDVLMAGTVYTNASGEGFGPIIVNAAGTGIWLGFRETSRLGLFTVTAWNTAVEPSSSYGWAGNAMLGYGQKGWYRISKRRCLGTDTYWFAVSLDGATWMHELAGYQPAAFTPAHIGWYVGVQNAAGTGRVVGMDWFDVARYGNIGNNLFRFPSSGTCTWTASVGVAGALASLSNGSLGDECYFGSGNPAGSYFQATWSVAQTINRLRFRPRGDAFGTAYVELSDGSRYPVYIGGGAWYHLDLPAPVTTTYVRIVWTKGPGTYGANPGFNEVEAYLAS